MTDVNTDENIADENKVEEAPKKAPVTGKLVKAFTQLGDTQDVRITPIDEDDKRMLPKTLNVAFGHEMQHRLQEDGTETDQKKLGRYCVSMPRVIDGIEDPLVVYGADAAKTIALSIKNSGRGNVDDYNVDADYETEFFKQKLEIVTVDRDDVYTNKIYAGVQDLLSDAAGEIEGLLDTAQGSTVQNQDDYLQVAKVLVKVKEALVEAGCKSFRHALASWAKGSSDGSNHPLLKKFGGGINALTEAMRLAELSEYEFDILPASQTSGKSIDGHRSAALAMLTEDAANVAASKPNPVPLPNQVTLGAAPDAAGAAHMLRLIAQYGFGIDNALDTEVFPFEALVAEVNKVAAEKAAVYRVDYGKHVNTYDKKELDFARLTYGRVVVSEGGHNLFADAAGQIIVISGYENRDEQTDEVIEQTVREVSALFKNSMMRACLAGIHKKAAILAKENNVREMMKVVEDEETGPTKPNIKGFGGINQTAAIGHIYKLLATRPDAAAIHKGLNALIASNPFDEPKVADAAE